MAEKRVAALCSFVVDLDRQHAGSASADRMSTIEQLFFDSQPWRRLGFLALFGYAVFLGLRFTPVAGSADASGYLNLARMLGEGRLTQPMRVPAGLEGVEWQHFTPLGFIAKTAESRELVPTYPPGLPLHFGAAGSVLGWTWGPLVVGVLGAVAAVWLVFALARELGLAPALAGASAVSLAVSTIFLFSAAQPMSDAISTAWCTGAIWAALRARRHLGWSAVCGTAFAVAVLVRPNNVLLLPALLLLLPWRWRAVAVFGAAGFPWAVALLAYQHYLYGDAWRTGYGAIWGIFSPRHVLPTLGFYVRWIPPMLPAAVIAVLAGWALPWRTRWRDLAGVAAWFFAFAGFYSFYLVTRESWWGVRFLLPSLPALLLLAAWGAQALVERWAKARREAWQTAGAAALGALALGFSAVWTGHFDLRGLRAADQPYVEAAAWLRAHAPAEAVVAAMQVSGSFYYYTGFPILRWDGTRPAEWRRFAAQFRATGCPVYAVLFPFEVERAFDQHMQDRWEKVAQIGSVGIWRLAP